MSNSTLREIAKQAKARLKSGNYYANQSKRYTELNDCSRLIDINKVIEIVESDEIIDNPIQRLIDKKYYESLTDISKQRYILNVAESYLKLKKMYLNSKSKQINLFETNQYVR